MSPKPKTQTAHAGSAPRSDTAPEGPNGAAESRAPAAGGLPLRTTLLVLAIALLARLAYVLEMRGHPLFAHPLGDAAAFDAWARSVAAGDLIGTGSFPLAPLYPYALGGVYALFGADPFTARLVQAVLGALTAALLARAAFRMFGGSAGAGRGAALFTGAAAALYGPAIHYEALLGKSALAGLLLASALAIVSGGRARIGVGRALLVGLCVGALALTRENAAVVLLPIGFWFVRGAGRLGAQRGAALAAGFALALSPAVARNLAAGVSAFPGANNAGVNLFIGNNEDADGLYTPLVAGRGSARFEAADSQSLAEAAEGRALTAAEVSRHWAGRAAGWAAAQPWDAALLLGRKLRLLASDVEWMDTTSYAVHRDESRVLGAFGLLGRFGWLLPFALAGLGLAWAERRRHPFPPAQAVAWAVALSLSVALFFVFGRFRLSLAIVLFPFAGRALSALRSGEVRADWRPVALFLLGVGAAWWPAPKGLERPAADTYNSLGIAQRDAGELEAARATFVRACKAAPDAAGPAFNLGLVELQLGNLADAAAAFDAASQRSALFAAEAQLELAEALMARGDATGAALRLGRAVDAGPVSGRDFMRVGRLARQLGQPALAERSYRRSLELDPTSAETRNNLGYLLQTQERYGPAAAAYAQALEAAPDFVPAIVNLAWLRVGAPDAAVRDAEEARALLARLIELRGPDHVDAQRLAEALED